MDPIEAPYVFRATPPSCALHGHQLMTVYIRTRRKLRWWNLWCFWLPRKKVGIRCVTDGCYFYVARPVEDMIEQRSDSVGQP